MLNRSTPLNRLSIGVDFWYNTHKRNLSMICAKPRQCRREFLKGVFSAAAAGAFPSLPAVAAHSAGKPRDAIALWQRETDLVTPKTYLDYMKDGDTRGFASLEKLERGFERVLEEAKTSVVGDVPRIWSVYNMGYLVKTRESLFSIDLVHRRDRELVPLLDFAFVTHNHCDHHRRGFCDAMAKAGKVVASNFLKNPAFDALKASGTAATSIGLGTWSSGRPSSTTTTSSGG